MVENDDADPWLAPDKLQHVMFCFSLTLIFSTLATCSPFPILRTNSMWIGSVLSLLAGTAKEAADHLGFFSSAGASLKDAVADVIGVLIALLVLYSWRRLSGRSAFDRGSSGSQRSDKKTDWLVRK